MNKVFQYPQKFGPIDAPDAPMTPEIFPVEPPRFKKRRGLAAVAPFLFFVDVQAAAPVDTGEWQFQAPAQPRRERNVAISATFQPIEIEPDSLRGLESGSQPQPRARRRWQSPPAIFAPPHVDAAAPVDTGEWQFQAPHQARKRLAPIDGGIFTPPHVDAAAPDPGFEWWQAPLQPRRKRAAPQRPTVFEPPHVEPAVDPGFEWIYQVQIPGRKRKLAPQSVTFAPIDVPQLDTGEWFYRTPDQFRRRKPNHPISIFAPIEAPQLVGNEWIFTHNQVRLKKKYVQSTSYFSPVSTDPTLAFPIDIRHELLNVYFATTYLHTVYFSTEENITVLF